MLLDQIYNKLLTDGVINGTTWKCFIGFLPDEQDQCIGLFETGGLPPDKINRETTMPTFQVRVRASKLSYADCRNKWQDVFRSLQDANQTGLSPDPLQKIYLMQAMQTAPIVVFDEKQRPNMTVNFRVIMAAS